MHDYNICTEADEVIFFKQCLAIEKKIDRLVKYDLITDVDGSLMQEYSLGNKRIVIHNCQDIGAVYIKSEVDLTLFFN